MRHDETALLVPLLTALQGHLTCDQHLVIGYSGGLDSTVLLHLAKRSAPKLRLRLSALHVHHGLSPAADAWAEHCLTTCAAWDVPLKVNTVAVERESSDGLEAAARRARHAAFGQALAQGADWMALAHHRDDQAETLLFNLLRGTGVAGAAAMRAANGRLLRPLLNISRHELQAYARQHRLTWVDDASNQDTHFSRNYLRHVVLAQLHPRFPAAAANLAAAARRFGEAHELLDDLAQMDLSDAPAQFPLSVKLLATLPEARARNLLRYLLQQQGIGIPSEARLVEFMRQCISAAPDRRPQTMFGDWRLVRRRGQVWAQRLGDTF